MNRTPRFHRGQRLGAADLNRIADLVERAERLTVGPGMRMINTPMGKVMALGEPIAQRTEVTGNGVQIGFVIITAASGTGDTITVRSVIRVEGGGYEDVGGSFEAFVWPGHVADDFGPLITGAGQSAKVVPIITVDGAKYVVQQFRWDVVIPKSTLIRTDCRIGP